jgi:hypothetical protein
MATTKGGEMSEHEESREKDEEEIQDLDLDTESEEGKEITERVKGGVRTFS